MYVEVIDIIEEYLTTHGYVGLFYDGKYSCACRKDELAPCGEIKRNCEAGIDIPCIRTFPNESMQTMCAENCEGGHIGPGEPKKPTPSSIARDAAEKCLSYLRLDGTWDAAILKGDKKQVTSIIQFAIDADRRSRKDWVLLGKCIEVLCGVSNFIHNNEIMQVIRQDTALEEIYVEVEGEIKDVMKRAVKGATR